jgi:hypothetical protein
MYNCIFCFVYKMLLSLSSPLSHIDIYACNSIRVTYLLACILNISECLSLFA